MKLKEFKKCVNLKKNYSYQNNMKHIFYIYMYIGENLKGMILKMFG